MPKRIGAVRELIGDEGDRLEAATRDDYQPSSGYPLASGPRRNEALFLRWHQVRWQEGQIVIERGQRGKGKRGSGFIVKLTPTIQNILRPLDGHHPDRDFTYRAKRTVNWTVKGRRYSLVKGERYPLTEDGVKAAWRRLRAKAGVTDFRLHDFRHDFATKLLRTTRNLKLVQKALNHSSPAMTARYAHVTEDEIGEGMEEMERQRERDRESRKEYRSAPRKVV